MRCLTGVEPPGAGLADARTVAALMEEPSWHSSPCTPLHPQAGFSRARTQHHVSISFWQAGRPRLLWVRSDPASEQGACAKPAALPVVTLARQLHLAGSTPAEPAAVP